MKRFVRAAVFVITLLTVSGFTECYKPVTKSQMPSYIKTVAVPAFQNNALRFKIEHRFTAAVMNELIRRGHGLEVQSEREGADAVIEGTVKSFGFSGVLLDDKGRARVFEVTITAAVTVTSTRTGCSMTIRILFFAVSSSLPMTREIFSTKKTRRCSAWRAALLNRSSRL